MEAYFNSQLEPWFRKKKVYILKCVFCDSDLCNRTMKASLLSDTKVKLFSTDLTPKPFIDFAGKCYSRKDCTCKVKDFACITCGNVVGYNVILPCQKCMESCNNGHAWIFHSDAIISLPRYNRKGSQILTWGQLEKENQEVKDSNIDDTEMFLR